MSSEHFEVLVVGGGTAGVSIAARRMASDKPPKVGLIEPSEHHYYQPIWTLVGGGVFPKEVSVRPEAEYIPKGVEWLRDRVKSFDPENSRVVTKGGKTITYDDLVVTLGIQLDWKKVKGLEDALGQGGVTSNYSYQTVEYTWKLMREFQGGNAIFTYPSTPIKCAGAPQKIMWLAEEHFRRSGVRDGSNVIFASAGAAIFGVAKYRTALEKLVAERNVEARFGHDLIEVRGREAVFKVDGKEKVLKFDMLHVTPPQSSPDVIKQSALADTAGWVEVNKHTLQHTRFPNVWSAGDCSSAPTSKTGAAVRKQVPVLVDNLLAKRAGEKVEAEYDGYASCPLVTGRGTVMLAEFGYDGKIMESFPFDQAEERYSMWLLKAYGLPSMYWNGMLRGRM
ncbi:MAG: NAD(P)/FAD-dependent oxidoreductase [Myxococcales bacterium]|nr:NAD(P)/FAD-dependent oxidoreductase [Myxococcales bacterium]